MLANIGAAKIILDNDLKYDILNSKIQEIIMNKDLQAKMSQNAEKIAIPNVEDRIYNEIKKLFNTKLDEMI